MCAIITLDLSGDMPLLFVLGLGAFVSGVTMRLTDPLVPAIARDLAVAPALVAVLATAFTFAYATAQTFVGALADTVGKVRIIQVCLGALVLVSALTALAPTILMLFIARAMAGAVTSGVFTIALGIVGDRVAFAERQVALSNLLMAVLIAQLFGQIASGFIADAYGWRAVAWIAAGATAIAFIATALWLKPRPDIERPPFNLTRIRAANGELLRNPVARACYAAVFVEGTVVMGFFPFVAVLLERRGAGGLIEAGFVLGGFGLGGITYTLFVRGILARAGGMLNVMRLGGLVSGAGYLVYASAGPWQLEIVGFVLVGLGFYMMHGSLQTQVTEVAPSNRATAVSLHSLFFVLGQGVGPVVFTVLTMAIGGTASAVIAGLVLGGLGMTAAAAIARHSEHA